MTTQLKDAWYAWDWDVPTMIVLAAILGFFVYEYLTSDATPIPGWEGNMVTHHLQPVFDAAPILRWIGVGIWLWVGPHLLFPGIERWITNVARHGF